MVPLNLSAYLSGNASNFSNVVLLAEKQGVFAPSYECVDWCRGIYEVSHANLIHNVHIWQLATAAACAGLVLSWLCWELMRRQRNEIREELARLNNADDKPAGEETHGRP